MMTRKEAMNRKELLEKLLQTITSDPRFRKLNPDLDAYVDEILDEISEMNRIINQNPSE
jgi:ribosome assembly protein YihI (activator of Der GTPase)